MSNPTPHPPPYESGIVFTRIDHGRAPDGFEFHAVVNGGVMGHLAEWRKPAEEKKT